MSIEPLSDSRLSAVFDAVTVNDEPFTVDSEPSTGPVLSNPVHPNANMNDVAILVVALEHGQRDVHASAEY